MTGFQTFASFDRSSLPGTPTLGQFHQMWVFLNLCELLRDRNVMAGLKSITPSTFKAEFRAHWGRATQIEEGPPNTGPPND
ncbi:MAG: hypothetical protein QOD93_46 [Acetobacteraceae bacterium]|jgi:hypothetical protein|nr:hypothetical protein [Acetobacteraceae bacterium]MEA2767084.1 hypothetical protein [Acetobacteraceae bacterium]